MSNFKTIEVKIPEVMGEIYNIIQPQGFIAGGAIRHLLNPHEEQLVDVDVFLTSVDGFSALAEKLKTKGFDETYNNNLVARFTRDIDRHFMHRNAIPPGAVITHDGGFAGVMARLRHSVDVVKPRKNNELLTYGTPVEVISSFDFTVCRGALMAVNDLSGEVLIDEKFEEDMKKKTLRVEHIVCPIGTLNRAFKYQKKGYHLPLPEMIKLFREWELRPESYRQQLMELIQLTEERQLTQEEIDELYFLLKVD